MTEHQIHEKLPSGFAYANPLQVDEFNRTDGSINGARKVCLVLTSSEDGVPPALAVRLGPPKTAASIKSSPALQEPAMRAEIRLTSAQEDSARRWYIEEYNRGWAAARREVSAEFDTGTSSAAFDDGYLDRAAGRPKWHLTYCTDHDRCGEA